MTPLLAHATHWLVDLLYAVPAVVLLIAGIVATIRERRRNS